MAGILVFIPAIFFACLPPPTGVDGTKPKDYGPQARAIISEIYPDWADRDRNLSSDELAYSSMIIESLCVVDEALDAEMIGGRAEMRLIAEALSGMGYRKATVVAITQCEHCAIGHQIYLDGEPLMAGISWPILEMREMTEEGRIEMVDMPLSKALIRAARQMREALIRAARQMREHAGQGWRRDPYALSYQAQFDVEDLLRQ